MVCGRLPIGAFGTELTTAQARAKAERLRGEMRDGRDPVGERRAARAASIASAAAAKQVEAEAAFTVRALIADWGAKHLASKRASYRDDALSRLYRHLAGTLDRPASSITRMEAVRILDRVAAGAGETTAPPRDELRSGRVVLDLASGGLLQATLLRACRRSVWRSAAIERPYTS